MAIYESKHAEHIAKEVSNLLRSWCTNRNSDSVNSQNLRNAEFSLGSRMIEGLVIGVQPEKRILLTIGASAIKGSQFTKGAYDMYSEHRKILEPHTSIVLERAEVLSDHSYRPPKKELFVGDLDTLIKIDNIAETLVSGGQLSVIEAAMASSWE